MEWTDFEDIFREAVEQAQQGRKHLVTQEIVDALIYKACKADNAVTELQGAIVSLTAACIVLKSSNVNQ